MSVATILIAIMWIFAAVYIFILTKDVFKHRSEWNTHKMGYNVAVSAFANFLDTLGIGSYALTTSAWKFNKSVKDNLIPGTLNAAFGIPMCVEATFFIKNVDVDSRTLVLMILSSMVGAAIGAKIISRLNINTVRLVIGIALCCVAAITLCKINGIGPFGIIGTATGLTGIKLIIGVVGTFIMGILMTAGIGLYAPCLALVLLLGMNANAAFPIMMGASAYLCLTCGITFVKEGSYERAITLPMMISGSIGVLIAGFIVISLPIKVLTYMVVCVMLICATMFFRDVRKAKKERANEDAVQSERVPELVVEA